jgi:hypothetical protein
MPTQSLVCFIPVTAAKRNRRYGEPVAKSAAGSVVGACIEDLDTSGKGSLELLEYMGAKFGLKSEGPRYSRASNSLSSIRLPTASCTSTYSGIDDALSRQRCDGLTPTINCLRWPEKEERGQVTMRNICSVVQTISRPAPEQGVAHTVQTLSIHEGLNQGASPPVGSASGTTEADGGSLQRQAEEGGYGEGGGELAD